MLVKLVTLLLFILAAYPGGTLAEREAAMRAARLDSAPDTNLNTNIEIDPMADLNHLAHRTERYRFGDGAELGAKLIVRRGQDVKMRFISPVREPLTVTATLQLKVDGSNYHSFATFGPGTAGAQAAGFSMELEEAADLSGDRGTEYIVTMRVPGDAPVGRYRVLWEAKSVDKRFKSTMEMEDPMVILFNPWSKADKDTFWNAMEGRTGDWYDMEGGEEALNEYVLNEHGFVYQGTSPRPWAYAQFDPHALPSALHAIEEAGLSPTERSQAPLVARALTMAGPYIILGKWSEPYAPHTEPWMWNGSDEILKGHVEGGWEQQRWGQCWVYGGLLTTLGRSLGLPTRTITVLASAHDMDEPYNRAIDHFYSADGRPERLSNDMVWNFHVWNDVWLTRQDLETPSLGGWQAIDATPQESSPRWADTYRMGPASIRSVYNHQPLMSDVAPTVSNQDGEMYDNTFAIAEVDAMEAHWVRKKGCNRNTLECFSLKRLEYGNAGSAILTQFGKEPQIITDLYRRDTKSDEYIRERHPWADDAQPSYSYAASGGDTRVEVFGEDGMPEDKRCTLELFWESMDHPHRRHPIGTHDLTARLRLGEGLRVIARVECPADSVASSDIHITTYLSGGDPGSMILVSEDRGHRDHVLASNGDGTAAEFTAELPEIAYGMYLGNRRRTFRISTSALTSAGQILVDSGSVFLEDRHINIAASSTSDSVNVAYRNPLSSPINNVSVRLSMGTGLVSLELDSIEPGHTWQLSIPVDATPSVFQKKLVSSSHAYRVTASAVPSGRSSHLDNTLRLSISSRDGRITAASGAHFAPLDSVDRNTPPSNGYRLTGNEQDDVNNEGSTWLIYAGVASASIVVGVAATIIVIARRRRRDAVLDGYAPLV